MRYLKMKHFVGVLTLLAVTGMTLASIPARAGNKHEPDLPSPLCDLVQAPEGNKVAFHVYARGAQIYKWNGTNWSFVGPMATLFADPGYHGQVGIHYAGPTWESNDGSKVVGAKVADCSPDPTAIPWLRLQSVSTQGPGIFGCVSFIQRVNTEGGLAPAIPGTTIGETAEVPYTAEYFFYRAQH